MSSGQETNTRCEIGQASGDTPENPCVEPHVRIDQAIEGSGAVVSRLYALLMRINPEPQNGAEGQKETGLPSLKDVLDQSAGRIDRNTNEAFDLINQIETQLFG